MAGNNGANLSALERLQATSEELEIWWDSSPLIYDKWSEEFLKELAEPDKSRMKDILGRLYNENKVENTIFSGVTTNPPLVARTLEFIPEYCAKNYQDLIKDLKKKNDVKTAAWELYKTIIKQGAKKYLPLFRSSQGRKGFVCGQVDPRSISDSKAMVTQALDLVKLSPNMMIKVPASKPGLEAFTALAALGVPLNGTLIYTVPQIVSVAKAIMAGLEAGKKNGVDYSHWRAVITIMMWRFEEAKEFENQAKERGIILSEELKRWAGIAVAKKGYQMLRQMNFPGKLLLAAFKPGPNIDGKQKYWHVDKFAGGGLVLTLNPGNIHDFLVTYDTEEIPSKIDEAIPDELLNTLKKIPYFVAGYEPDGINFEDFAKLEPAVDTAAFFNQSMGKIKQYVDGID